jgi:hypothetical protein
MKYVVAAAAAFAAYLMAGIPWEMVGDEIAARLSAVVQGFTFRHALWASIIGALIAGGLVHWRRKANAAKWRRTLAARARA